MKNRINLFLTILFLLFEVCDFIFEYAFIVAKSILSLYKNTKPQQIVSITKNQIFYEDQILQ